MWKSYIVDKVRENLTKQMHHNSRRYKDFLYKLQPLVSMWITKVQDVKLHWLIKEPDNNRNMEKQGNQSPKGEQL